MKCKVCQSDRMHNFLSLGETPLANSFIMEENLSKKEGMYPLDVYFCENCCFVQIGHVVDPEVLFKDYIYVSSTSRTLGDQFRDLVEDVKTRIDSNAFVVEIASNDGTLLKNFDGYNVLGVEPASNVAKIAIESGVRTLNVFFNRESAKGIVETYGKADVVIGTNVFAHIPDLNNFVKALKDVLAEDGFAVFESPYLVDLIQNFEFDTIYHEHIFYLSMSALVPFFRGHGLELFDVKRTKMHGGAIRFYVGKKEVQSSVGELLSLEKGLGLDRKDAYDGFASKVEGLKVTLNDLLRKLKQEGHSIVGYGAPAKGNTLLNYADIGPDTLNFIVDKSPLKQGMYTPGKKIPVYSPDMLAKEKPNYALILAWNFADEIMKEQKSFKDGGGKFIVPVPEPRIV